MYYFSFSYLISYESKNVVTVSVTVKVNNLVLRGRSGSTDVFSFLLVNQDKYIDPAVPVYDYFSILPHQDCRILFQVVEDNGSFSKVLKLKFRMAENLSLPRNDKGRLENGWYLNYTWEEREVFLPND